MPAAPLFTLVLALWSATVLAQPPAAEPPSHSAVPDTGLDPALTRDTTQYNLDKSGLAIQGYDPVAYFPEGGAKPAKGKKELSYKYRGVTYRFATAANLGAFKKNPRKYEPAHGGWCSWAMADGGKKVEIDPKAYKLTDGRLFLFYTDLLSDARTPWNRDEPRYIRDADGHWKTISAEDPRIAPEPAAQPHK